MSNLEYKNPLTALQLNSQQSVPRNVNRGVSFSVLNTGGYMEVYNLDDLIWNYSGETLQTITGSTIPVDFYKGGATPFQPDVLTLNSDNISSGRRRLGMLVYVYETDLI